MPNPKHKTTPKNNHPSATAAALASDLLIAMGGKATAIKAADGVEVPADAPPTADGYLVRFTSADDPDITAMKDFFTSETYFGEAERVPVYFHHGLPVVITDAATGATKTIGPGKTKIGTGSLKADDTGIFIDAIIDEAGEYQGAVQQLLDAGLLGWSSGVPNHLVVRDPVTDESGTVKAHSIKQWLLAEGSLTHTPAEPRNLAGAAAVAPALTSVKSLLGTYGTYSWDYENGYSCDSDWNPAENMGAAAADVLTYRLEKACRNIIGDDALTPAEQITAISGCFDEAKGFLTSLVNALASVGNAGENDSVTESVKSAFVKYVPAGEMPGSLPAPSALSLSEQGDQVLAAVTAYTKRAGEVQALRRRSGASLPPTHAEIATKSLAALTALQSRLSGHSGKSADTAAEKPAPAGDAEAAKVAADAAAAAATATDAAGKEPAAQTDVEPAPDADAESVKSAAVAAALERARKLGVGV